MSEEEAEEFCDGGGVFDVEEVADRLTWDLLSDAFDDPNIMVLTGNIPWKLRKAIRGNPEQVREILAGLND